MDNNMLERSKITLLRSDTLPMGEGGKGERSDARTFRASSDGIKSPQLDESGISPFQSSIQDQYKNTNIETLINGLVELYDKLITKPITDFYNNIYNLDNAQGIGLDLWGERLNFPRTIKYIDEETEVESSVTLQDDEYRLVLKVLTLKLYTQMSVPGINKTLKELFTYYNAHAYTTDEQDMTYVNYIFLWEIPEYLKQAFSNYDLLPHPLAVGTRYREANYKIFGFKGQNLSDNFYRAIFQKMPLKDKQVFGFKNQKVLENLYKAQFYKKER